MFHIYYLNLIVSGTLFIFCNSLQAAPKVYGFELVNRMSVSKDEHYNIFFKELTHHGLEHQLIVSSFLRRNRSFKKDVQSCLFPANQMILRRVLSSDFNTPLIAAQPLEYAGVTVLTHNTGLRIESSADLAGKKIGFDRVLSPKKYFKDISKIQFLSIDNNDKLLHLLSRKKVDAILGFMPDLLLAASKLALPLPHLNNVWIIPKLPFSLVCHDTVANREFVKRFNQLLKELQKSGRLREIMGPYVNLTNTREEYF